jgi:hypothetical protein
VRFSPFTLPSVSSVFPLSIALATSAQADPSATLRYELSLQSCQEVVSGLRTCDEAKVGSPPLVWAPGSGDSSLVWNENLTDALRLRAPASALLTGQMSKQVQNGMGVVCLNTLEVRVEALPESHWVQAGPVCLPLAGGSAPLFAFYSWRPEGDRYDTTYSLRVSGSFDVSTGSLAPAQ